MVDDLLSRAIDGGEKQADWSREIPERFWDPGRKLLKAIRQYQRWHHNRSALGRIVCRWAAVRHRFWSIVTGAEIPLNCKIGGGLLIPHPNGIVVHPEAEIGVNCLIFQQVTIGTRNDLGAPRIAAHVDIGAGAKILGPVKVEAYARIGANAVVLTDVARSKAAVGIHKSSGDNQ
ncbi:serine acetyltransferase [Bradyrhizobium sp. Tv2a-2]|uniref:serine acetyltransferase n=1 Tax=Bradyrhizobium sp. Tv2a-2 TaxID=113395 RepID=UPI000A019D62|nr:serine acetyltransferase [Bradyrhizobium sp. Tv2a-2]